MNDTQILEQLSNADVYAPDVEMPASAWSRAATLTEIERRIDMQTHEVKVETPPPAPPQRRLGWLIAAAAFAMVLIIGMAVMLASGSDPGTTVPPATEVPPTTVAVPTTAVAPTTAIQPSDVSAEAQALIDDFEDAYNAGDAAAAGVVVAPAAVAQFAPWADAGAAPSATSIVDRVETAALFEEKARFGECVLIGTIVECPVELSDVFSRHLQLTPWTQTWSFELADGRIASVGVDGASAVREEEMQAFSDWSLEQGIGTAVLAGPQEWVRTELVADSVRESLLEYGAIRSGVPADTWAIVEEFYRAYNAADFESFVSLFADGGLRTTPFFVDSPGGLEIEYEARTAEFRERFLAFEFASRIEWQATRCTGTEAEVACETIENSIWTYPTESKGVVTFFVGPEGIREADEDLARSLDLVFQWRFDWVPENRPDGLELWPEPNQIPFSQEGVAFVLDAYVPYLVDLGYTLPDRYLEP